MKYIITESSRHKLINYYLDSLKLKTFRHGRDILVNDPNDDYKGIFDYIYSEDELLIEPFLITIISGMFDMDRGQSMEGIAIWFEDKFDVTVLSAREWTW